MRVVTHRVLRPNLFRNLREASRNSRRPRLGVQLPARSSDVNRQNVIPHLERQMDAIHKACVRHLDIVHQRRIHGNLISLQVTNHIFRLRRAAIFLAIAYDIHDPPTLRPNLRRSLRRRQDSVIQSVHFTRRIQLDSLMIADRSRIRVKILIVDIGRLRERSAQGHQRLTPHRFRPLQHRIQSGTLPARKPGLLLRSVVIRKNRNLIVGAERTLQRAKGIIHLGHLVKRHRLIDHQRNRKRERVGRKELHLLPQTILKHAHIAPGQSRYQDALLVLHRKRHLHKVHLLDQRKRLRPLTSRRQFRCLTVIIMSTLGSLCRRCRRKGSPRCIRVRRCSRRWGSPNSRRNRPKWYSLRLRSIRNGLLGYFLRSSTL